MGALAGWLDPRGSAGYGSLHYRGGTVRQTRGKDVTLRDEVIQRIDAVDKSRAWAKKMANKHQVIHYFLGIAGVVAGAGAAAAAALSDETWIPGVLGLLAGAFAGAQTILRPQRMVQHHWTRFAELGRLGEDYSALLHAAEEPSVAKLDELAARKEKIDLPPSE